MKRAAILSISLIFSFTAPLLAEEAGDPQVPEFTAAQQAFLNLPEEERQRFVEIVNDAARLFQEKRIFETLEKVHEANRIFDGSPELMNLQASCYVEIRNFDRAMEIYKIAEELAPDNPSIKFNIAEVYFVTGKWQQSHGRFSALMEQIPEENVALGRLVEFKIMLTKIRLDRMDEAQALAEKYDFLDDSPFHYYANAALAFEAQDEINAEEWIARATRIFRNPQILAPWQDTLIEFGYIRSFYGGDIQPGN